MACCWGERNRIESDESLCGSVIHGCFIAAVTTCSQGKGLQFRIHSERELELVSREAEWPCEKEADWKSEWRQGRKHNLYLCENHAREQGLVW